MSSNDPGFASMAGILILSVLEILLFIYNIYAAVISFIGGTYPIVNIETEGGLAMGFAFIFVILPAVHLILFYAGMFILAPFLVMIEDIFFGISTDD